MVWPCALPAGAFAEAGREVEFPRPSCPACAGPLVFWSGYRRWLRAADRCWKIFVPRLRCGPCAVTHVLLPAFVLAWRLDAAETIGAVLAEVAGGRCGVRPAAGRAGVPCTTARGWVRRFRRRAPARDRLRGAGGGAGREELYRAAEQAEPGRYRQGLALTLFNLGVTLTRLGRPHDACAAEAEAVELYWAAEQAEPGRYREGLARTLTNLSASLSVLGRHQDACVATAEAVELLHAAEQAEPGRFRADLAGALASLGASLSRLGRSEEALSVTGEAVGLYRILKDTDAAAYHGRLADTLVAWSGILLDLGRVQTPRRPGGRLTFMATRVEANGCPGQTLARMFWQSPETVETSGLVIMCGEPCPCRKPHPCSSCRMLVFMEHSAESVASSYIKAGDLVRGQGRHGQWLERAGVRDALMRPVPVVELLEFP